MPKPLETVPKPPKLTLHVVEGPAGAGKTRLLLERQKNTRWPVVSIPFLKRPRDYGEGAGESLAWAKEIATFNEALRLQCKVEHWSKEDIEFRGFVDILIDRFILSRMVYRYLRKRRRAFGELRITAVGLGLHITQTFNALASVHSYFWHHIEDDTTRVQDNIHLNWSIIIPTEKALTAQRRMAGREYPFTVSDEIDAYNQVYTLLRDARTQDFGYLTWEVQVINPEVTPAHEPYLS